MDKDEAEGKTHLQQVSTLLSKRKKETFSKSNVSTVGRRAIISIGVLRKKTGVIKLVTVLATSMPITIAREEVFEDGENLSSNFAQIPYIYYLINFANKFVSALFDSSSKINAIYPTFAKD